MITTYQDFLNENTGFSERDPRYYGITDFEWVNGRLNVNGDVKINDIRISKLPYPFGTIKGNFECIDNQLTTLENSPIEVYGSFDCRNNFIDSLEGCPVYVKEKFSFSINGGIKTFDNCPKEVGYMNCPIYLVDESQNRELEDYPLCIINDPECFKYSEYRINGIRMFYLIAQIVYDNKEKFRPLLDNKKAFHLMVITIRQKVIPYYTSFIDKLPIEDFPMIIPIQKNLFGACKIEFDELANLVYDNAQVFEPLLDDKIKFHQQAMRMKPDLIKYYTTIKLPSKKTFI